MPSLLGSRSGSTVMHQIPRQIKKVSVPVVPDITTQKYGIYEMNVIGEGTVTEDFHELEHSVMLQQRNGLLECGKYNKNTKSLTNVLHHVPCTSTTTLMVPSSFCFGDDSYSVRSLFSKRKDQFSVPEFYCISTGIFIYYLVFNLCIRYLFCPDHPPPAL
ncbi:unnamed protein product [Wuchereria bancrofti]|uniref:Uncharacterized protein n=1 Tax=Wuchereria bancrofti TaxID=6293 RepID=A0A3P7FJW2_WUCBA|nr:unnamed protein product [Wuchereria bancrofti]